ncbi:MAG: putative inner rane transporter yiJE, partial [Pseudomonadota bacterium]
MVRFTFLPCHTFRHAYEFFVRFPVISRRQLMVLVALTLMWGVNWPMMKLSLQQISPLYFRASTML